MTFPTYREGLPEAVPPFDNPGGSGNRAVYPYTRRANMTTEKSNLSWRAVHLENQYLHCLILPDLGGRLYTCRDKLSGKDMFYANSAIKKGDVGPRGAWVAAGIETSFPIARSRLNVSPVRFTTSTNTDGSATVSLGATDRVSGMEWHVSFTLRPTLAVLEQKVWLYNPGPVRQPYQWWTNAALRHPDTGLELTYPMFVTAPHGAGAIDTWPIDVTNVDRSRTINYIDNLGVFAYGSREPFFAAYDPQSHTGVAHWADPKEVPGKKVWVYGANDKLYRDQLSDDHSGYTEIQAGLLTTQDMMEFMEPEQTRTFTELWIPARDTAGITRVTPDVVLSLQRLPSDDDQAHAHIDLTVTHPIPHGTLTVTRGGKKVLEQSVDFDPAKTFHADVPPKEGAGKFHVEVRDRSGKSLLSHEEDAWDATGLTEVKVGDPMPTPPAPAGKEAAALAAVERLELVRGNDRASIDYDSALANFSQSAEVRKAVGRFRAGLRRFGDAAPVLESAHRDNPSDAEITYYLAVARAESGGEAEARTLWESIAADPRFGTASQIATACSMARSGQTDAALATLHRLAANGPSRAARLEVPLLRLATRTKEAQAALDKALAADPTDSLLRLESVALGHKDDAIWRLLAADPEWVLDVVNEYFSVGLYGDAIALLDRQYPAVSPLETEPGAVLPQDYPLIAYYRGYARLRLGQSPAADFAKASGQSTLYVHPYRTSSFAVLRAAIEQNPADSKAHYLLGALLLNSRQADAALAEWKLAKPGAAGIPGYDETVSRVMSTMKSGGRVADTPVSESSSPGLSNTSVKSMLTEAAPPTATVAAAPSFDTPLAGVEIALLALARGDRAAARAVFQPDNFPGYKQPPEVRQAYAELSMQTLLVVARPGNCEQVETLIRNLIPENPALLFTIRGAADLSSSLRMQFYFGMAEASCGDRKAAIARWSKIAQAKSSLASPDYAFPVLAASLVDPAGATRLIETALETIRTGAEPADKGLKLYTEAMLLRAAGRDEDAIARLREGVEASAKSPFVRYLNGAAQHDPPLPR